jgi:histidinol phosphatase-like PHP family hydrolase
MMSNILNLDKRDYHMHSVTFSDGLATIDDMVKFAWDIWLQEIAITDHSDAAVKGFKERCWFYPSGARYTLKRWQNVWNDVKVIFWVEWDILNGEGDICTSIQWIESDFLILSAHVDVYKWDPSTVTGATIKAIEKYHKKIKFIGHPCNNADFWEFCDIEKLVVAANQYGVPLECNAKNIVRGKTNLEKLDYLLRNANQVYLNSDAHTLHELKYAREFAINYLKENWYI